jgi:glycerophosphoryl diester phosphodiesterase
MGPGMSRYPLIIGHRGACGHLPEHTLESYQRAIELGADCLETDIVLSRDGHLICRHDCELSLTTDVADRSEFRGRITVKAIDGSKMQGWFVEDFTLKEIKMLRARERFAFRDHSHDGQFNLITLAELLEFAAHSQTRLGHRPGVLIEIKHAAYFDSIGLPIDEPVARALRDFPLAGSDAPAWVECFEIDILHRMRKLISTPLIQLLDAPPMQPADVAAAGGSLTYGEMMTPQGLAEIATYANAIGAWKRLIVPASRDRKDDATLERLQTPTSLISDAHAAGLAVHAWTFRSEPRFLAADYDNDPAREYQQFESLGIDGMITDFPDAALRRQ